MQMPQMAPKAADDVLMRGFIARAPKAVKPPHGGNCGATPPPFDRILLNMFAHGFAVCRATRRKDTI